MNDERVREMRRAFDEAFAAPAREKTEETENILALRIKGDPYGLSVREIAGVATGGHLVPVPSRAPHLLGLTGIRGMLVPVYSLAGLLGYPPGPEAPHWLALWGARETIGLAVGEFEGYLQIPRSSLHAPDREARKHVHQLVQAGNVVRSMISVASVIAAVKQTP